MKQQQKKKRKFKKRYWLLVDLAIAVVVIVLLLYKPGRYDPPSIGDVASDPRQVPPYLTHILAPAINDGVQLGEPFDLVIKQAGINQVVAWYYKYKWPREHEGVHFSSPMVVFVPRRIVLMGTANVKDVELVATIEVEPKVDEEGLLHLAMAKLKIGAMNVTPVAKFVAKKMYHEQVGTANVDRRDLGAQIAGALLDGKPFEPVFRVENDERVRVKKITVREQELIVHLIPSS